MGTDRRVGIGLIALAVLALVVVNRINGRDVQGEAVALPWTPPPAVGSCLKFPDAESAANDPQQVPCDEPHNVQVLQSWRTGDQPEGSSRCDSQGAMRSMADSADWQAPQPWLGSSLVRGGDPLGWVACVMGPMSTGPQMTSLLFTGTLSPVPDGEAAPQIGSCFRDPDQQVDCTVAHFTERIGEFMPQDLSRKPATSCEDFARSVVGAKAFQGPNPLRAYTSEDPSIGVTMLDGDAQRMIPMTICNVRSADLGRELTDSVIGLGGKPIPYG